MDSPESQLLDDSPPPIPPQSSPRRTLFFQSPAEPWNDHTATVGEETPASPAAGAGESVSEDETSDGYADPSDVDPTSSKASSADKPAALLSKHQMRQTAATAVKVGTGMAHTVAAKTELQQQVGLYLADDEDAANIGHPLADIMHRRGDIVGGKLSPDANDFLRSLMGVAGYFAKQVAKIGAIRQHEAGARAAEVQHFPEAAA